MAKYRTKPKIVEAFKWTADASQTENPEWVVKALKNGMVWLNWQDNGIVIMRSKTRDGYKTAKPGDYLIRDDPYVVPHTAEDFEANHYIVAEDQ